MPPANFCYGKCFLCILSRDNDNPRTHAESIYSEQRCGLDRRLRRTTLNTEQNQLAIYSISGHLKLPQRCWLRISSGEFKSRLIEPAGLEPAPLKMLTYKFVKICSTPLTTAPRRLNGQLSNKIYKSWSMWSVITRCPVLNAVVEIMPNK